MLLHGNQIIKKVRAVESALNLPPIGVRFEDSAHPSCMPLKDETGLHIRTTNVIDHTALAKELTLLAFVVDSQRGITADFDAVRDRIEKLCGASD